MEKILFLAHTENGNLAKSHREVFQASLDLAEKLSASELSVGLVGEQVEDAARTLASDRVCRFLAVTGETFGPSRYATDTAAAEALRHARLPDPSVEPTRLACNLSTSKGGLRTLFGEHRRFLSGTGVSTASSKFRSTMSRSISASSGSLKI